MRITGALHDGTFAEVRIDLVKRHGHMVWQQRKVTDSAAHLNRDYVCNETIHDILVNWVPCDWKQYKAWHEEDMAAFLDERGTKLWSTMSEEEA